jgi:hypothetical protein
MLLERHSFPLGTGRRRSPRCSRCRSSDRHAQTGLSSFADIAPAGSPQPDARKVRCACMALPRTSVAAAMLLSEREHIRSDCI